MFLASHRPKQLHVKSKLHRTNALVEQCKLASLHSDWQSVTTLIYIVSNNQVSRCKNFNRATTLTHSWQMQRKTWGNIQTKFHILAHMQPQINLKLYILLAEFGWSCLLFFPLHSSNIYSNRQYPWGWNSETVCYFRESEYYCPCCHKKQMYAL